MAFAQKMLRSKSVIAGVLFSFSLIVFLFSNVHQIADSNYSMLLSQSLLYQRTVSLDHYSIPRLQPKQQKGYVSNGDIYQLELMNGHLYYFFPPGSAVLSLPYVAVMNALGVSASNPDGTHNQRGETMLEVGLAALLMAGLVVVVFYTSNWLLPVGSSVIVALGSGFGTQIWSTASRALWSDTWGIFLLSLVLWLLIGAVTGQTVVRPILMATLLAWLYFVRPTYLLSGLAIAGYVLISFPRVAGRFLLVALFWAVIFFGYSEHEFGQLLPNYYRPGRLSFASFREALAGNLLSPSRGLLIFVPIILFVFYLVIRYRAQLALKPMLAIGLATICAHLIVISGFVPWWGGHSYGPRYMTGIMPWLIVIAAIGLRARLDGESKVKTSSRRAEAILGGVLLFGSIAINGVGALSPSSWRWNVNPINIDEQPERVWDFRHPQFLPWI